MLSLGHVLIHADDAGDVARLVLQGRRREQHVDFPAVGSHPSGLVSREGLAVAHAVSHGTVLVGERWRHVGQRLADHVGRGPSEDLLRRPVPHPRYSVGIDAADGDRSTLHDGLKLIAGLAQALQRLGRTHRLFGGTLRLLLGARAFLLGLRRGVLGELAESQVLLCLLFGPLPLDMQVTAHKAHRDCGDGEDQESNNTCRRGQGRDAMRLTEQQRDDSDREPGGEESTAASGE